MSTPRSSGPAQKDAVASDDALRELRVLHVFSGNLYGGIETYLRTLAEQRALCPSMRPTFAGCFEGRLATELRAAGAEVVILPTPKTSRPWTIARARKALREMLDARQFDSVVCHAAWVYAMLAPVMRETNASLVFYLHDLAKPVEWLFAWSRLTRPDLVIANSEFTAKTAPRVFGNVAVKVVRLPLAATARIEEQRRSTLRANLGATDQDVVILLASRLESWKGHRLLIEALAAMPTSLPWLCWIAGGAQREKEASYLAQLRKQVMDLGLDRRVNFIGQRADVRDVMQAADIYCQPNLAPEPFGLVFVEALAAGLAVVTTETAGGALESVDDSCGVVSPANAGALGKRLTQLVGQRDLRHALGAAGPSRAALLTEPRRCLNDLSSAIRSSSIAHDRAPRRLTASAVAAMSEGSSDDAVHAAVERVLAKHEGTYGCAVDVGCGRGSLGRRLHGRVASYIGCDLVAYDGFPREPWAEFRATDLNGRIPVPDGQADLVLCVEVIEHVENPRALMREFVRIMRPGGRIVVTTPNQLSLLSTLSLVTKGEFMAFQEAPGLYPAHITALVEADLRRIASEAGLVEIDISFTDVGRIPLSARRWPARLGFRGRRFSDNIVLTAVNSLPHNPGRAV